MTKSGKAKKDDDKNLVEEVNLDSLLMWEFEDNEENSEKTKMTIESFDLLEKKENEIKCLKIEVRIKEE